MRILKKVLTVLLIAAAVLFLAGFAAVKIFLTPDKAVKAGTLKELTAEQKLEDFRYLYATLKDSFPFFEIEKEKTGFDWLANKDRFEEQVKETKNNVEFYSTLKGIVAMVQNGHTQVLPPSYYEGYVQGYSGIMNRAWNQVLTQDGVREKYKGWGKIIDEGKMVLPVKIQYIEGKYVVNEDYKDMKKGYVLDAIDNMPIDDYFKVNLDKYYLNYDDKRDKLYVKANLITADGGRIYKITAVKRDGQKVTSDLTPARYEQNSSPGSKETTSSEEKILEKNKVAYLKVKSMSSSTLESDGKKIAGFYKSIRDYPYLIIDIRENGGGSDYYWQKNIVEPLISQNKTESVAMAYKGSYIKPFLTARGVMPQSIEKLPEKFSSKYASAMECFVTTLNTVPPVDPVGFKGKIHLLVDDYVFSSSESFAAFCKATGFATLVGTTTGGDGIGMDPCLMALPNSGLVVRFSLDMGINSDGTVNEKVHTKPDVFSETTYNDFINGRDTVLEKVVELCSKPR